MSGLHEADRMALDRMTKVASRAEARVAELEANNIEQRKLLWEVAEIGGKHANQAVTLTIRVEELENEVLAAGDEWERLYEKHKESLIRVAQLEADLKVTRLLDGNEKS